MEKKKERKKKEILCVIFFIFLGWNMNKPAERERAVWCLSVESNCRKELQALQTNLLLRQRANLNNLLLRVRLKAAVIDPTSVV